MTLDRLSQITEVGIKSGITLRNINIEGAYVSGVVTATTLNADNYSGNATGRINPSALNVTGVATFQGNVFHGDGDIAYFGDGNDLLIFHNSTDSIIRDNGTGDLFIEGGNRIRLTSPTGIETYAIFNQDGASELYFDNVKRFETTGAGVSVYGGVTATGVSTFSNINVGTGASISSPTINVLTLGTNNAERVRITGIGSVGINEISPDLPLHISGSNAYPASSGSVPRGFISLRAKSAGATHGLHMGVANASPFGSWIQAQDANALGTNYPLLLNPNGGNIGIGTINPATTLDVRGGKLLIVQSGTPTGVYNYPLNVHVGSGAAGLQITNGSNYSYFASDGTSMILGSDVGTSGNKLIVSRTCPDSSFVMKSSGDINLGAGSDWGARLNMAELSSTQNVLHPWAAGGSYTGNIIYSYTNSSGTGFNFYQCNNIGGIVFRVRGDGTIFAANTTVQSTSDIRLKENIRDYEVGLNQILSLRPVRYDWKQGINGSLKNQIGFIAQEVQSIIPEAVDIFQNNEDDPENPYLSMGSSAFIPAMINAIQEQQKQIEDLKIEIANLKNNIVAS